MKSKNIITLSLVIIMAVSLISASPISANGKPKPNATPTPTLSTAPTPTPTVAPTPTPDYAPLSTCASSTPPSGTYTVTLCFTEPSSGSAITGDTSVTISVDVTGTNPGVARVQFFINNYQLITDFQTPYSFLLPTTKWQDGIYNISVTAFMRDGYNTANQASIDLTFNNGISQPPTNQGSFTPSSGTNPPVGSPFTVVAAGDGVDGANYATLVSNEILSLNPNLFLYLGDVYEDGTIAEFYNWYGTGSTSYSRLLSITNPTIGNHEYIGSSAAGYFDYWNNIPDYYSFDAGGWHFVSLNSNASHIGVSSTSAQYAWLQQDLAANANTCTIVYYHHPLFNIGPEGSSTSMSDIWALMAQNGVSIVVNGHDHDYQRWIPLDGSGNPSSTGITEFVAGGGGHGLQTIASSDPRVAFSDDLNPEAFGALQLALNPDGANFSYVNSSGVILDSGVVQCNKAGPDTQAPSVPSNVTATVVGATQVDLSWQASTDNVGVSGYTIYRDNSMIATVAGSTLAYTDHTVLPSSSYSYSVEAFDPAGNYSPQSAPIGATTPAMPPTLIFTVGADVYVNSGSPSFNYGSATVWRVDGSPDIHSYLRFTIQGLAGYAIQSAYLNVFANSSSAYGINALTVGDNSWIENAVTYNTAPALGSLIGSSSSFSSSTWVAIDVTSYVTGEGTYSFGVTTPGSTTISFAAKESGVNPAQLIVNLVLDDSEAPSVPTGLNASASSATQVDLTWQPSSDNIGVTGYTIYRDGATLASVDGTTLSYSDTTAQPSSSYSYTVDAFDLVGNHSAQSTPVGVTTPAMPSSLTFTVEADTYVNSDFPTSNYGSATAWRVDGSPDIHSYLRFTVQGLAGYAIQSAYLNVYANSSSNIGIDALSVADNTWDENTVTYDTAPALGGLIGSSPTFASGTWVPIDVTSYVTGEGTYSFGINTPGSSTISFAAKEGGVNAAQLIITLDIADIEAPSVPSGLTASASSATQVDLSWLASTDNVGVEGYTIYRDGTVLTSVSGSTISYSDLSAQESTTYTYSVDAFDAAGNHSAQSTPINVTTPALPSSITYPVIADSYVNFSSPDSNYGSISVWRVDGSPDLHAFLKFNILGLNGAPVTHAYLHVYANTNSPAGISAYSIADNTWDESTITYNNAPQIGTLLGSSGRFGSGTWVTFDVTVFVTGDGTYSFVINTPGSKALSFASKESGINAAYLELTFQ
jgi:chitodextrinase